MLVSVVIPAFNQAHYLSLALQSALTQTHQDLEIIVVDDGSTDGTAEVCRAITDPRLRYIYQANDRTHGLGARNRGMIEARGEWIALLDQDDVWHHEKLAAQLERARAEPEAGCIFCLAQFIDSEGAVTSQQRAELPQGDVYPALLTKNFYYVSTSLFRRTLLSVAGIPGEPCGFGDWQLWLSIARHTRVAVVQQHLCDYRIQPQGYLQQQHANNRIRWPMGHWNTLLAHRHRVPLDRPDCLAALAKGMDRSSDVFFKVALMEARDRNVSKCHEAMKMARRASPWHSAKPSVLLKRYRKLAKAYLGFSSPEGIRAP